VKINGKEHDVPSILMRAWIREARLAAIISNPAPDARERELAAALALLADDDDIRNTVMLDEVREETPVFRLPEPLKTVPDLNKYNTYGALLRYVQQHHGDYDFVDSAYILNDAGSPCLPHKSAGYRLYTHIVYQGYK
jgi:hypothetical protein